MCHLLAMIAMSLVVSICGWLTGTMLYQAMVSGMSTLYDKATYLEHATGHVVLFRILPWLNRRWKQAWKISLTVGCWFGKVLWEFGMDGTTAILEAMFPWLITCARVGTPLLLFADLCWVTHRLSNPIPIPLPRTPPDKHRWRYTYFPSLYRRSYPLCLRQARHYTG